MPCLFKPIKTFRKKTKKVIFRKLEKRGWEKGRNSLGGGNYGGGGGRIWFQKAEENPPEQPCPRGRSHRRKKKKKIAPTEEGRESKIFLTVVDTQQE